MTFRNSSSLLSVVWLFALSNSLCVFAQQPPAINLLSEGKWESNEEKAERRREGVALTSRGIVCSTVTLRDVDLRRYPELVFNVTYVSPGRRYSLVTDVPEGHGGRILCIDTEFPVRHRIPLAETFLTNRLDNVKLHLWTGGERGTVVVSEFYLDGSPALPEAQILVATQAQQQLWGFGGQADGELLELGGAWDGVTDTDYCRVLDAAKEMGVTMVRIGCDWHDFTSTGGPKTRDVLSRVFRYLKERDIEPLLVPWGIPMGAEGKPVGSREWLCGYAQSCVDYLVYLRDTMHVPVRFFELTNEPHGQPGVFTQEILGALAREFLARCETAQLQISLVGPDNNELKWAIPWHEGLNRQADVIGAKGGIATPSQVDWEAGQIRCNEDVISRLVGWDIPMFYTEFGTWAYTDTKPYVQPGVHGYDRWESGLDMAQLCTEYLNAGLSVVLFWELYDVRRTTQEAGFFRYGAIAYKTEGWRKRPKYYLMKCVFGGVPRGAYVLRTIPMGGPRSVALSWPSGLHVGIINPYNFDKIVRVQLPEAEWDSTARVFTTKRDQVSTDSTATVENNSVTLSLPAYGGVGVNLARVHRDSRGRALGPNLSYRKEYAFDPPYSQVGATKETYPDTNGKELTDGAVSQTFFDGRSVGWAEGTTQITVDLTQNMNIDKVGLWLEVGGVYAVRPPERIGIEVSSDCKIWRSVCEKVIPDENLKQNVVRSYEIPVQASGRFVRFTLKNRNWTMVSEVEVFRGSENVAANKPYTTSPDRAMYLEPRPCPLVLTDSLHASNIRPNRRTAVFLGASKRSVIIDLGSQVTVQTAIVRCARIQQMNLALPEAVSVSLSSDGINWKTAGEISPPHSTAAGWVPLEVCFEPSQARYVRLYFRGASVAVDEIEVYGSAV